MFVMRPPWPALLSLAIIMGVAELGCRVVPLIGLRREAVDYGAGFIIVTAALCAVLHPLVWFGVPHLIGVVRTIGWAMAVIGIASSPRWLRRGWTLVGQLDDWWCELRALDRALALLISVILLAYFLIVLGPACDVDSLDYHLGAPLDWMLHGSIYPRWDWIHAHLVGLGEMISMMGLAAGTDNLGALFEFASLLIMAAAATTFASGVRQRLMGVLLIAGCPVMLELGIFQKPELMPAVAMTAALILIVREWEDLRPATMVAAFICVGFAAACKYSFILSAPVLTAAGLVAAYRARRLQIALGIGVAALIALPMQVWARNYLLYHDPLPPMLEFLKARPDALALGMAKYFHSAVFYGHQRLKLAMSFICVIHPEQFGGCLGFGVLAFIPALQRRGKPPSGVGQSVIGGLAPLSGRQIQVMLVAAGVLIVILAIFSQQMPRFFIEPYLWIAVVAAGAPEGLPKAIIKGLLAIQGVLIAGIAIYYATVLFPGALRERWRDYAMDRAAFSFAESRNLNSQMPNGLVLTMVETHALLRPPFMVLSETFHLPAAPGFARAAEVLSNGSATAVYLQQSIVDYFIKYDPVLAPCFADAIDQGVHIKHRPLLWYAPDDDQVWRLFRLTRGCAGKAKNSSSGAEPQQGERSSRE
ncbi:MAG TPA: DUF1420 family protein [Candidatus Binataceae bacterium]|nr:DUF1420 family protein [Candidatus Binataceae bacterium]